MRPSIGSLRSSQLSRGLHVESQYLSKVGVATEYFKHCMTSFHKEKKYPYRAVTPKEGQARIHSKSSERVLGAIRMLRRKHAAINLTPGCQRAGNTARRAVARV